MNRAITNNEAWQSACWRMYVAQDPELHQLDLEQRRNYHRRVVKVYYHNRRASRRKAIIEKIYNAVAMAAVSFLFVAVVSCILLFL